MTHELKLYFAPGACSRVPLIALEMIGAPFTTELVIFMKGAHKSPEFKSLNPSSKIPVLTIDGVAISQNLAILTWLNEVYLDAALLPGTRTPLEQAKNLSLLSRFPSDLHPLVSRIRVPQFFCDLKGAPDRVAEMASAAMREQLQPFENSLGSQTWLAGSEWSIIDAYLHWVWYRITGAGFDGTDFPNISTHYKKTLEIPAVKRAMDREAEAEAFLTAQGLMPQFLKPKLALTGGR